MRWASPGKCNRRFTDAGSPQIARLTGHTLLCLHKNRRAERAWAHTCERLYSDCVDGMSFELTYGRQLVIVHHLGLPGGHGKVRLQCIINFVTLKNNRQVFIVQIRKIGQENLIKVRWGISLPEGEPEMR